VLASDGQQAVASQNWHDQSKYKITKPIFDSRETDRKTEPHPTPLIEVPPEVKNSFTNVFSNLKLGSANLFSFFFSRT
jgi:hypothetical protein